MTSEYLFTDKWLTLRKDTCQRPDGQIVSPYYVTEYSTWVTVACFVDDKTMLLVKQYRHALGEECIETPGGCVDDTDKDLETAARREILEETGYEFEEYTYLGKVSPNPSTNNNLMHMYMARNGKKVAEQNLDQNEDIEIMLLSIDDVKKLIVENKIMQSMHLVCMFYAFLKLDEVKM